MESRAAFKEIGPEFRSGLAADGDTGYIPPESRYKNPGPTPNLRGVEANTGRGTKNIMPMISGAPGVEYAACTDQPIVDPYRVWEN